VRPDFQFKDKVGIYLDNAATTVVAEDVVDAMHQYWEFKYGNPGTVYELGREAQDSVDQSRELIVDILKCSPEELFFTSGGTESNNWAIKGFRKGSKGIMVSSVEHDSVLKAAKWESEDNNVPYYEIPVDQYGVVNLVQMERELKTRQYALVSIQYANNEIGTIQPVEQIADLCHKYGVIYHCDAVQALGKIDFDVDDVKADMISFSAHKIHGPMGIGALYIKNGTPIDPLLHGGGQENGMRSGTLAVPLIVGFAKAAEMAVDSIKQEMPRLKKMTDDLSGMICNFFKGAKRNGHPTEMLPNILSLTIPSVEAELICSIMNVRYTTSIATGSACSTIKRQSHVLEAIGGGSEDVFHTLRISLSRYNKEKEMDLVFANLQNAFRDAQSRSLI